MRLSITDQPFSLHNYWILHENYNDNFHAAKVVMNSRPFATKTKGNNM